MFGMNVEWDHQQPQGHKRQPQPQRRQTEGGKGFLSNLFGKKEEEQRMQSGHVYYYTSRPDAPRRAETISVLPAGVKMPKGDMPEVSYGADGSKYLVIPPRRSNSTSRHIVVQSGGSTPKRKDSTSSRHDSRPTPRRSNSTQARAKSPPVSYRPKIVGDPELVKHPSSRSRRTSTR